MTMHIVFDLISEQSDFLARLGSFFLIQIWPNKRTLPPQRQAYNANG